MTERGVPDVLSRTRVCYAGVSSIHVSMQQPGESVSRPSSGVADERLRDWPAPRRKSQFLEHFYFGQATAGTSSDGHDGHDELGEVCS